MSAGKGTVKARIDQDLLSGFDREWENQPGQTNHSEQLTKLS